MRHLITALLLLPLACVAQVGNGCDYRYRECLGWSPCGQHLTTADPWGRALGLMQGDTLRLYYPSGVGQSPWQQVRMDLYIAADTIACPQTRKSFHLKRCPL